MRKVPEHKTCTDVASHLSLVMPFVWPLQLNIVVTKLLVSWYGAGSVQSLFFQLI